jgi:xanthine dehydrogenase accessory factor
MWDWISKASELQRQGEVFALVTLTGSKGSSPRNSGAKFIVLPNGEFFGTVGGGRLEELVIEDSLNCLEEAISDSHKYGLCVRGKQCCGGTVDTFVEVIGLGPKLYLFGAGHVGQSLAQTLVGTPYTVHLIDEREEWIDHKDLPNSVVRHRDGWKNFVENAEWNSQRTHVAVMTHDHDLDFSLIANIVQRPAKYIGLIGSQTKWKKFEQRLISDNVNADAIARVNCPIGLPIGGKAPREVAVSVAAELLQLHNQS